MNSIEPLDAIIFDVGNVLFQYDPQRVLATLLPHSPYHNQYLNELLNHERWQQLDRGDLTLESLKDELVTPTCLTADQWPDIVSIVNKFVETLRPIPETIACFQKWDYPKYILSNFQDKPFTQLSHLHPFLNQAKGTVISAREGFNKPETNIYHIILERYNLTPSRVLFIDDLPQNIKQARQLGLHGIVFQSPSQLRRDIARFGLPWPY